MRKRIQSADFGVPRRWLSSLAVAAGAVLAMALSPAAAFAAGGEQVYSSIPDPLPANLPSLGGEAYSFGELGDQVQFAASGGKLGEVEVTMSDWACEEGHWNVTGEGACTTTPGTGFEVPITFNIYEVGEEDAVGPLLATKTQTFFIPYRPSSTSEHGCDGQSWYDEASETCNHGLAMNISFDFASQELVLPEKVIYGVSYDTTHHGPEPVGEGAACYSSSGGCGYDALNIALAEEVLTGSQVHPGTLYWDSSYAGFYCDEGAAGTGTFRLDSPSSACWSGLHPGGCLLHRRGGQPPDLAERLPAGELAEPHRRLGRAVHQQGRLSRLPRHRPQASSSPPPRRPPPPRRLPSPWRAPGALRSRPPRQAVPALLAANRAPR